MKRMTIKEIDKFIDKLQLIEISGNAARYKVNAIAYLNLLCAEIEYKGKNSVPIREEE